VSNFFSSLFGGANSDLNTDIGATGQLAGNLSGQGQKYTNQAGDFFSSLVSGDAGKISQTLAPDISAAKTRNSETQKSNAEMGTRSGGIAATNAASSDKLHSDITNMVGSLTGGAAGSLASLGSNLTSQGLGAYSQNEAFSQQRMANWMSSILGKGITGAAQAGEAFATGGVGGMATGGSFLSGGAAGLSEGSPFFGG
jgi:hypothetical protein